MARSARRWPRYAAAGAVVALLGCIIATIVLPLIWPVAPLESTVSPLALKERDSRFTVIDGALVHFKLYGSEDAAQTITLLHGFGASTFSWRYVAPLLAEEYQVVVIDRPGFGLTERVLPPNGFAWRDDSPYSVRSQSALVFTVLDRLGVERTAVVGHSQGAAVAAAMAIEAPQRVSALVLTAPALNGGGPVPSWLAPVLRTPGGRRLGPLAMRSIGDSGTDQILRRAYADPASLTDEVRAGYRKPLQVEQWDQGLWELSISPQPLVPSARLGELAGVPTLVIIPGSDRIVPPDRQRAWAAEIPGARVVEAAEQAHLYHEERAAQFVGSVEEFLAEPDPAPAP